MKHRKSGKASNNNNKFRGQRGITMLEALSAVAVIVVMAGVVLPNVYSEFEKARLSGCKAEVDLMKAVAYDLGDGRYIPTPDQYWAEGFPNAAAGEYYYIVDNQDANLGHGNDLDGCDEENPGNSPRCPNDIKFVVLCGHDHGSLGKYVYATDNDSPTLVLGDSDDPGYQAWLGINNDDGSKKIGKRPKSTR